MFDLDKPLLVRLSHLLGWLAWWFDAVAFLLRKASHAALTPSIRAIQARHAS